MLRFEPTSQGVFVFLMGGSTTQLWVNSSSWSFFKTKTQRFFQWRTSRQYFLFKVWWTSCVILMTQTSLGKWQSILDCASLGRFSYIFSFLINLYYSWVCFDEGVLRLWSVVLRRHITCFIQMYSHACIYIYINLLYTNRTFKKRERERHPPDKKN